MVCRDMLYVISNYIRKDVLISYTLMFPRLQINPTNGLFLWACLNNNKQLVSELLESPYIDPTCHNAISDTSDRTIQKTIVRWLLSYEGLQIYAYDLALYNQFGVFFETILDTPDNCAIRWASCRGYEQIVALLLADCRADPSANGNDSIKIAAKNGHQQVVRLLLADSRVDPSVNNNEALYVASRFGHQHIVSLLLTDSRVSSDTTSIVAASLFGHQQVVALLLANSRSNFTMLDLLSAMSAALIAGRRQIITILLADPRMIISSNSAWGFQKITDILSIVHLTYNSPRRKQISRLLVYFTFISYPYFRSEFIFYFIFILLVYFILFFICSQ